VQAEIFRFEAAIARAKQELSALEGQIPRMRRASSTPSSTCTAMILEDSSLSQAPKELIRERRTTAEWALVQQMESCGAVRGDGDPYLRERRQDIEQVVERVLKALGRRPKGVRALPSDRGQPHRGRGTTCRPPT